MKYCYQCGHMTSGEPLFCLFCGASYDAKLCPRLHVNPRYAEVCSQCGSRDLSVPQPKVPFWGKILVALVTVLLWIVLLTFTFLLALVFLKQVFTSPNLLGDLIGIAFILALLWWIWMQIPLWMRKTMHRLLRGKDKEKRR